MLRNEQAPGPQIVVGLVAIDDGCNSQRGDSRPGCGLGLAPVARETQAPERSERQHRGLACLRDGDAARLRVDGGSDVAMIDLGGPSIAYRPRLALLLHRISWVQRPSPLRIGVLVDHGGVSLDLQGVDAAAHLAPYLCVQPDDLGDEGALELRSATALRPGRVPLAEQQGGRGVAEQVGGIAGTGVSDGPTNVAEAEQRSVEQAVPEDRIGHPVGRLQHRDPAQIIQIGLAGEVHVRHREAQFALLPAV